jgi:hypothetical protein
MAGACLMRPSRRRYSPAAMGVDAGKKMVVGFNHNLKHKGRTYHVQTEDSGLENPHVITHLFVGGNVIASKKTSYADIVRAENLPRVVRDLMEEQHKEMLRNLVDGVYDDAGAAASKAQAFQPGQIEADGRTVQLQPGMSVPAPRDSRRAAATGARPAAPTRAGEGAEAPFGEELIAERSLDEVILSYLAEDLGGRK